MIGISDDESNFPEKLLLTNRQIANLRIAFAKHTSTDVKLSKLNYLKQYNQEDFSWETYRSVTMNRIAINKKCN